MSFSLSSLFSRPAADRLLPVLPLPIRGHYKTPEELQLLAAALARNEAVRLPDYEVFDFNKRLAENAGLILHAYRSSDAASRNGETITPAAQWLLDNYYVVDKSMQQARRDLPDKFLRQLPLAANIHPDGAALKNVAKEETSQSLPRVFALAWLYVAHSDSNFSLKSLKALVDGFQSVEPLRIGELWALPSVIRFMLVENARRLALRVERARAMRNFANRVADKIVVTSSPEELQSILTEYSEPARDGTFATHLLYRLRSSSTATGPAIEWLEAQLEASGHDVEEVIVEEHARQSTGGMTMGNIIRSLKTIDDVDWTSWVETVSIMDAILRENSDFEDLDFASRNSYRVTIEKIARNSLMTEIEVTNTALKLAREKSVREHKITEREQSGAIAYYLSGNARTELEQVCGYKPPLSTRLLRWYRGLGLLGIAVPVWTMTIGLLALIYICMGRIGFNESEQLLFTILALFPAYEASLGLFNSLVPWFVQPNRLVGYEYRDGLPADARTLVAVPTLINSRDSVDEHIRNLEVHYLTNPRGEVYFAIVSD
ncbi:protein ndvB, partial [Ochrobactrum sp. MR28]|nr:protein ndvB [Ochrobactrum sp. MR28]